MNKAKFLSSDELGEKGESRFKELCADARLICNKSDRDRAGWDFVVDFTFDDQQPTTLDKRIAPPSCHVQAKTILSSTKAARLTLSMAERLAKELKPAFIIVMKVNSHKDVADLYVIHVLNDRLAKILRRLREADPKLGPQSPINKQYITFTPREDERIGISGDALRAALVAACGDDLQHYSNNKRTQLEKLGFDEKSLKGRMSFHAGSSDELGDILLGLRSLVPVTNLETTETRFGITVRLDGPTEAKITVQPRPFDRCKLVFKNNSALPPAILDAEVFFVPAVVTGGDDRVHIRSEFLQLDFFPKRAPDKFELKFDPASKRATPSVWWHYWRAFHVLSTGGGSIEIRGAKSAVMQCPEATAGNIPPPSVFEHFMTLCNCVDNILKYSGINTPPNVDWEQIESSAAHIVFLSSLITNETPELVFNIPDSSDFSKVLNATLIISNKIEIGSHTVAYYALASSKLKVIKKGSKMALSGYVLKSITTIGEGDLSIETFTENAKIIEGIDAVCQINPALDID